MPSVLCREARRFLLVLLRQLQTGRLDIIEAGAVTRYGPDDGGISAELRVRDQRAWWAVATEGSIGLGRSYFEGWWESDDAVAVVRLIIANLEPLHGWQRRKAALSRLRPRSSWARRSRQAAQDRDDIATHYDIGTDFFSLFLDETLTYSAGVFPSDDATLRQASLHKYDRLLDKLDVGPGDRVLEIGTGWGGFAVHTASTRSCHVTTATISADQHREATRRVVEAGLGRSIDVVRVDWRDLTGRYDKIVSIEMVEAVSWREYDQFFATVERCLAPDGAAGIQAICVPGHRFETAKRTEDFIKRFVFPGGGLPSLDAILSAVSGATRMQLVDVEDLAAHYAETLARWRARFEAHWDEIAALGFDDRFRRLWWFYLAYCEAAFTERQCTVDQLVLVGRDWRQRGLALRPH